jgi:hypothetical protein
MGGLVNLMWRIEISSGLYAVKQLSCSIDLSNGAIINNYNLTETIAGKFVECGIRGIYGLKTEEDNFLYIVNNTGFLVYPWVNGKQIDWESALIFLKNLQIILFVILFAGDDV